MKEIFHIHMTKWQFIANSHGDLRFFLNKDRNGTLVKATHHRDGSYTVHIVLTARFSVIENLIKSYRSETTGSGLKWFDQVDAEYRQMLASIPVDTEEFDLAWNYL